MDKTNLIFGIIIIISALFSYLIIKNNNMAIWKFWIIIPIFLVIIGIYYVIISII